MHRNLSHNPKNIILRMPNWLGDLVMATPVIKDVKKHYPSSHLTVMAQSNVASLLEKDPHIDELYSFSRPSGWLRRAEGRDIIGTLRNGRYDLGILLTHSLSSAWFFWRGGVRSILGYEGHWRKALLTNSLPNIPKNDPRHQVVRYKQLLTALEIPLSTTAPYLCIGESEEAEVWKRLKGLGVEKGHTIVGINPGAAYGSAKCWLPERYREVARRLIENPAIRVLFFGDKNGAELVQKICVGLPDSVINLSASTRLRELVTLLKICNVLLTNDSGPMHIASALGTPLLALFGSTSDVATGPYNQGRVIHKHVECSPCYKRTCPIDFRCMTKISVEEVYQQLEEIVAEELLPVL